MTPTYRILGFECLQPWQATAIAHAAVQRAFACRPCEIELDQAPAFAVGAALPELDRLEPGRWRVVALIEPESRQVLVDAVYRTPGPEPSPEELQERAARLYARAEHLGVRYRFGRLSAAGLDTFQSALAMLDNAGRELG